jgi:hypothetical protein
MHSFDEISPVVRVRETEARADNGKPRHTQIGIESSRFDQDPRVQPSVGVEQTLELPESGEGLG